jgi:hypothetical protein
MFFPVRTETNRNSNRFGCFPVCFAKPKKHFFGLFRYFRLVSKQPNKQNFLKTNRNKPKKSPKHVLYKGVLETVNFFSRFEPKQTETPSVLVVLGFAFWRNTKFFFSVCFDLFKCFGLVSKQPKQTELMVWGIKKVDIFTNLLLFWLVFRLFRLFRLFRNTETPCFDIKAKQPKQTSCFG